MSDATIAKCLFTEGDVICVKCGAVTWWESPEAKCKWVQVASPSHDIIHSIYFEKWFVEGGQLHSSVQAWKWIVMAIAMNMSGGITVTS